MKIESREEFHDATQQGVALVDFNAAWCPPCRAQKSTLQELEETYKDRATIAELDVDEHVEIATDHSIQSVPTLILFKAGTEIRRFIGLHSWETLSQAVEKALEEGSAI